MGLEKNNIKKEEGKNYEVVVMSISASPSWW